MKKTTKHEPDYIFETSWEVCNKVGGIYAVLSTRAASMQKEHPDKVIFFGPDFGEHSNIYFREDHTLLPEWQKSIRAKKLPYTFRIGRWDVPSQPIAILLKWDHLWEHKDEIYYWAWEHFEVRSHAAYGDYDDSCMFSYAAGQLMGTLASYIYSQQPNCQIVAHANEWQTAFTVFYLRHFYPQIGTLFTTHATSIGRSIAGNGKPLYDQFEHYNGDQMAEELNMVSKHSAEKQAAHWADCFTTVSDLTAKECAQLLDKTVDIVTPNGFESSFIPEGIFFDAQRLKARQALTDTAEAVLGDKIPQTSVYVGIAGRQEWKNKGIDIFFESLKSIGNILYHHHNDWSGDVIAFVMVPYLDMPVIRIGRVLIISVPYYLNGSSIPADSPYHPLQGYHYYDLLIGLDVTAYPSYYEPWGYTPLESLAFHVPTITTDKAGFGLWAEENGYTRLEQGVEVIHRTDSNFYEVIDTINQKIYQFTQWTSQQKEAARQGASEIAAKADWKHFFQYYRQAYAIALTKSQARVAATSNTSRSKK